ncbi:MAG: F0F1 ATP synthase subunit gamma, partial [Oscillospiraceae bacterium]
LNLAQDCIAQHDNATLFVVGQVGRAHFLHKKIPIATDFLYTAQEPTLLRAREIGSIMLKLFESEALDEIDVLYTRMLPPFQ